MTSRGFFFSADRGTPATQQFRPAFANPLQMLVGIFVGYQTFPTQPNVYYALGVQFEDVARADAKVCISNMLTVTPAYGNNDPSDGRADHIHVWNGMGWDKYFFHKTMNGFVKALSGTTCEDHITTDTISTGATVFFVRSSKGTAGDPVTLSGGVTRFADTFQVELVASQYRFVANPWPVPMPVASVKNLVKDASGAAANYGNNSATDGRADHVHVWNGMAWDKYYYHKGLDGYVSADDEANPKITEAVIPAGEGFFFVRSSKGLVGDKLVFTKPSSL